MKGIVCKEVGRFEWTDDLPEPERRAGEAAVAIQRVGICGTDLHAFKGNQPYFTYPLRRRPAATFHGRLRRHGQRGIDDAFFSICGAWW
ncbi:alcohol dehydrogenase catalytic domain-containing protein [Cohnella thermotolerans]|uniref:alcohol dehydrogenase catalytic domain-containing protein n=1 Tax=Cohnella thermotolerans TaxID=329858 RepID=UPI000420BE8A